MKMLRVVTWLAILDLFVTAEKVKPKTINLALETVLAFDNRDKTADLKFIDDVQDFLSKVKTAVQKKKSSARTNVPSKGNYEEDEKNGYDSRKHDKKRNKLRSNGHNQKGGRHKDSRRNFAYDDTVKFTDFIKECIDILKSYEDGDLEDIFEVIQNEIRKYHYKGCKFHELLERRDIRKYVAEKLDLIKDKPARVLRNVLDNMLDFIDDSKYDVRKANILDYIDSLYGNSDIEEFNSVLDNLKRYGSKRYKRSNIDLIRLIRTALRTAVFDHYSFLNTNTRKDFKIKLESLWRDFAHLDNTKKLSIQYTVKKNSPDIGNVIRASKNTRNESSCETDNVDSKEPKSSETTTIPNDNNDYSHNDDDSHSEENPVKDILRPRKIAPNISEKGSKPVLREKNEGSEEIFMNSDERKSLESKSFESDVNNNNKGDNNETKDNKIHKSTPLFISLEEIVGVKIINSSAFARTTKKKRSSFITLYPANIRLNSKILRNGMKITTKLPNLTLWPEQDQMKKMTTEKYAINKELNLVINVAKHERFATPNKIRILYKVPDSKTSLRQQSNKTESEEYTAEDTGEFMAAETQDKQNLINNDNKDSEEYSLDSISKQDSKVNESDNDKMVDSNGRETNKNGKILKYEKYRVNKQNSSVENNKRLKNLSNSEKRVSEAYKMNDSYEYKTEKRKSRFNFDDKQKLKPKVGEKYKNIERVGTSRLSEAEKYEHSSIEDINEHSTIKRNQKNKPIKIAEKPKPETGTSKEYTNKNDADMDDESSRDRSETDKSEENKVINSKEQDNYETNVVEHSKSKYFKSSEENLSIDSMNDKREETSIKPNKKAMNIVTNFNVKGGKDNRITPIDAIHLNLHFSSLKKNKPMSKPEMKFRHDEATSSREPLEEGLSIHTHYTTKTPRPHFDDHPKPYSKKDLRRLYGVQLKDKINEPKSTTNTATESVDTTVQTEIATFPRLDFWQGTPPDIQNNNSNITEEFNTTQSIIDRNETTTHMDVTLNLTSPNAGNKTQENTIAQSSQLGSKSSQILTTPVDIHINKRFNENVQLFNRAQWTSQTIELNTNNEQSQSTKTTESVLLFEQNTTTSNKINPKLKKESNLNLSDHPFHSKAIGKISKPSSEQSKTRSNKSKTAFPKYVAHLSEITNKIPFESNNERSWTAATSYRSETGKIKHTESIVDATDKYREEIAAYDLYELEKAKTLTTNEHAKAVTENIAKILKSIDKGGEFLDTVEKRYANRSMPVAPPEDDEIHEIMKKYGISTPSPEEFNINEYTGTKGTEKDREILERMQKDMSMLFRRENAKSDPFPAETEFPDPFQDLKEVP